ncbi:MAG: hypothetical protein AAGC67_11275 [Myxococcota bacterium]
MRVIRAEEAPEYGVGLGSVLVSLLEPAPGKARQFNRWYERDHFYAGCMTGAHFFSGRRFVATRDLKALRYPASSAQVPDTSIGSFLALYWMEQGHHQPAEDWSLERVLWLYENGRMDGGGARQAVHAGFYAHRVAVTRDDDGIPPEVALDHPFPGLALMLSERPAGVSRAEREAWLLERDLPERLPGSPIALCLSLELLPLPESSPAFVPPDEGADRRGLELFFLDASPQAVWADAFADFGAAQEAAGVGRVSMASAFVPTVPGTDRHVDEV